MPLNLTVKDLLTMAGLPAEVVNEAIGTATKWQPRPIESFPRGGICPSCFQNGEALTQAGRIAVSFCRSCTVQWFMTEEAKKADIRFCDYKLVPAVLPSTNVTN